MAKIQIITLKDKQKEQLEAMLKKGRWSPREIKRAQVLLMADDTKQISNIEIGRNLGLTRDTVRIIKKRFIEKDLETAIFDRPRPGHPKKLSNKDEAFIIATACSEAPDDNDHWTLVLLKKELKRKRGVEISTEPIRKLLLKNKVKPWRKKNVVCA
jgi:transposase